MKKQIIETISKIFVVTAVAVSLTGAVFAQKPQKAESIQQNRQTLEQLRRQIQTETANKAFSIKKAQNGSYVTEVNQFNFLLGNFFAFTILDAEFDYEEGDYTYTAE